VKLVTLPVHLICTGKPTLCLYLFGNSLVVSTYRLIELLAQQQHADCWKADVKTDCSIRDSRTKVLFTGSTVRTSAIKLMVKVKVKMSLCLTKHHTMKTYWGVEM
jgi:hypothetical protein